MSEQEKTYTREQLIEAQIKYNQDYIKNPETFEENPNWEDPDTAERSINFLLSLVENEK